MIKAGLVNQRAVLILSLEVFQVPKLASSHPQRKETGRFPSFIACDTSQRGKDYDEKQLAIRYLSADELIDECYLLEIETDGDRFVSETEEEEEFFKGQGRTEDEVLLNKNEI